MSFTYDAVNLATDKVAQVRLRAGDQVQGNGLLPGGKNFNDEEIQFYLTQNTESIDRTAVALLESAIARWASMPDQSIGPQSWSVGKVAQNLRAAIEQIRSTSQDFDAGTWSVDGKRADGYSNRAGNPEGTGFNYIDETEW